MTEVHMHCVHDMQNVIVFTNNYNAFSNHPVNSFASEIPLQYYENP